VACSVEHFGAVSPALSRIRVAKLEETGIDLAIACAGCVERFCLECPSDALSIGSRGEMRLDSGMCNSCGICADACPIGAVGFHEGQPLICDLCGGRVVCIAACPNHALSVCENVAVTLEEFRAFQGNAAERRALHAQARGRWLRESWRKGMRVDL
jgi:Fe-S-cluster-containing hydrogenase component 2